MISYMTDGIKLTVRPGNIQINFYMNPDKSEHLLYTEWVQVVTNVRHKCLPCTQKKYSLCGQVIFFGFGMHCLFKNMSIQSSFNDIYPFPRINNNCRLFSHLPLYFGCLYCKQYRPISDSS